jgi:hypothetical protein
MANYLISWMLLFGKPLSARLPHNQSLAHRLPPNSLSLLLQVLIFRGDKFAQSFYPLSLDALGYVPNGIKLVIKAFVYGG